MIDAHVHLWNPAGRRYPWMARPGLAPIRRAYTVDDLRAHAGANGVSGAVLVQTVGHTDETARFLATAANSGGLVAGVVGWVDLTAAAVADRLAQLVGGPGGERLVGIRHQVEDEASPDWLLRDDVASGIAAVGRTGLAYDLLVHSNGLGACIAVADAHPDVGFVLDHAAKPPIAGGRLDDWRRGIAALARRDNVSVKLSGLVTEADWSSWNVADLAPVADHLLGAFGPERVMFGSDWPVCELAAAYDAVVAAAAELTRSLSDDERADVFGRTAARVYGLVPG